MKTIKNNMKSKQYHRRDQLQDPTDSKEIDVNHYRKFLTFQTIQLKIFEVYQIKTLKIKIKSHRELNH